MNKIIFKKDNIFTSDCQTLVNTVNCVGVMGAGIALEYKYRYPVMFEKYVEHCKKKLIEVGKLWIYDIPESNQKILNFPTKKDWKQPSKYEYLEKGLQRFLECYHDKKITSIAFPLLGAQNGGLEPEKVLDLMYKYLEKCDIPIEIYEFNPSAKDDLFLIFTDILRNNSLNTVEKLSGLGPNTIGKLRDAIEFSSFNSLIQLGKIKGLGEDNIKKCFQLCMKYKYRKISVPKTIFNEGEAHFENSLTTIEGTSSLTEQNSSEFNHYTKKIANTNIQDSDSLESPHPNKIITSLGNERKQNKNKKVYNEYQKLMYTGLDQETLKRIDEKSEDVTIKQIKQYCDGLKINLKTFFNNTYVTTENYSKLENKSKKSGSKKK